MKRCMLPVRWQLDFRGTVAVDHRPPEARGESRYTQPLSADRLVREPPAAGPRRCALAASSGHFPDFDGFGLHGFLVAVRFDIAP